MVVEPLDLLPARGNLAIYGQTDPAQSGPSRLVIQCSPPVDVVGSRVTWMAIQPRHAGVSFDGLPRGESIVVSGEMRASAGAPDPLFFVGDVALSLPTEESGRFGDETDSAI